jgi:protease IV
MRRLGRIIVAILAFVGVLTLGSVALATWAAVHLKSAIGKPDLPAHMLLTLDLERPFRETGDDNPLADFTPRKDYVLRDVVAAIDRAARDDRVAGLFATAGATGLGMARVQEIRDAITRFRASGKPAVVFADTLEGGSGATRGYYLASAFGQIWLQPSGEIALTGFSAESPFLHGTFDMLGIAPQFAARWEYKSAIEPLTATRYSDAQRENLGRLLASWSDQVVSGVAAGRHLAADQVRAAMDKSPLLAAEALKAGLVDKLGYRDEALASLTGQPPEATDQKEHPDTAKPREIDIARYAAHAPHASGPRIALITGTGAIQRGRDDQPFGDGEGFGADTIAKAFRDAVADHRVKAILFRIDSPGGSYVASDTVWHEVRRARAAGKPVVVSMGDVAASGGYFVGMAADRVVAEPGTLTGSIGVFSGKIVLKDFWSKLGVTWDELHQGDNAGLWSANAPFSPAQWTRLNTVLDTIYADFTAKAVEGRKIPADRIDALARGRVWSGADAKAAGLVDALGGLDKAMAELRPLIGLQPDAPLDLVAYPKPKQPWEKLAEIAMLADHADGSETSVLAHLVRVLSPLAAALDTLSPAATEQAQLRLAPGLAGAIDAQAGTAP